MKNGVLGMLNVPHSRKCPKSGLTKAFQNLHFNTYVKTYPNGFFTGGFHQLQIPLSHSGRQIRRQGHETSNSGHCKQTRLMFRQEMYICRMGHKSRQMMPFLLLFLRRQ